MLDKSESKIKLQNKIRESIPQSNSMQFSIAELASDSIVVKAPLSENYNIHGTGFAGSIYSLAVLAGWALCHHNMELFEMDGDLVVGKAEIIYKSPVTEDIVCSTSISRDEQKSFHRDFKDKGKSAIQLTIKIGESENAILKAHYFAIATKLK